MRDVKFRVWDEENKIMLSDPFVWFNPVFRDKHFKQYPVVHAEEGSNFIRKYVLLQYTGLKDSSDPPKEIFEGDIIQDKTIPDSGLKVVEYKGYGYLPFTDDWDLMSLDCEVIGNIYENPELLNG